jgi:diguanylate cyclase (GGDEF)-like protein/PAS domain S-box-containing protein
LAGLPFSSLRSRLAALTLLAAIPVAGLALWAGVAQRNDAVERSRRDTLLLTRLASSNHDRLVELTRQFLSTLTHLPEVRGGDPAQCNPLLDTLLHQHPIYADIGLLTTEGRVVCSSLPTLEGGAVRSAPFVAHVAGTKDFAVGKVERRGIPPRPTLGFGYPVFGEGGDVRGVAYADLDLAWLQEFAEEAKVPPGGALALVEGDGTVLAHHPDGAKLAGRKSDAPLVRAIQERRAEGVAEVAGIDGARRLYAFAPLRKQGEAGDLFVAVGVPPDTVTADADRRLLRHVAVVGAVALLSIAAAWAVGRRAFFLRRPRARRAGDPAPVLPDPVLRGDLDEGPGALGQLAREFDQMAEVLQRRQQETDAAHQESRVAVARKTAILEGALDAVITVDAEGRIVEFNPAAESTFGHTRAQALGAFLETLVVPVRFRKEGEGGLKYLATAEDIEHGRRVERLATRADGTEFPVEVSVTAIAGDDGPPLYTAFLRDITERKRAEEVLRTARDDLQRRVEARTAELKEANERLVDWVEELQARAQDMRLLSELGDHLQACQTVEEAFSVVAQYGSALFPEQPGALCMMSEGHPLVESVASWGEPPPREEVFPPEDCWALRRGRPHVVEGAEAQVVCRHVGTPAPAAYVCVPLMAQGQALGILHLVEGRKEKAGSGEVAPHHLLAHRQLAFTVADRMALSVSNLRLQAKLRDQAIRDGLTGLFNRRYMQESLERELRRAQRRNMSLGVIMLDIDHFKKFNDTFGHAAGDTLLRHVGALLQEHTRGEDIACRYGGEEFTLILLDASPEDTEQRAEKLREEASTLSIEHGRQHLGAVTISLGVAVYPDHADGSEALLKAADAALYRAKEGGRNRVMVASQAAETR